MQYILRAKCFNGGWDIVAICVTEEEACSIALARWKEYSFCGPDDVRNKYFIKRGIYSFVLGGVRHSVFRIFRMAGDSPRDDVFILELKMFAPVGEQQEIPESPFPV